MANGKEDRPALKFHKRYEQHYQTKISAIVHREDVAKEILPKGRGIEIGPMYWPTPLSGREVFYIDAFTKDQTNDNYEGKFPSKDHSAGSIDVDYVGTIGDFADAGLDFVVANHVLEHVPAPIDFMNDVAKAMRVGGRCMVALPDKRYTDDKARTLSTYSDLICGELRLEAQIADYIFHCEKVRDKATIRKMVQSIICNKYDPHLWIFDMNSAPLALVMAFEQVGVPISLVTTSWNENFNEIILFFERMK